MAKAPRSPFRHLLFRNGWIIANRHLRAPRGWRTRSIGGGYRLSYPKGSPVSIESRVGRHVAVVGRPVDVEANSGSRAKIAGRLADAMADGALEDALRTLAGRFIVTITDADGPRLYQDASGARGVFYRSGVAASHSALAARDADQLDGDVARMWSNIDESTPGVNYLPGIRGPHEGVRMLTPNTWLSIPSGRVQRFWPNAVRRETYDIDALANSVARTLTRSARRAVATWPLLGSLSAGIDSRLTLAACRSLTDQIGFFSHINPDHPHPVHVSDMAVAQHMAEVLGLDHRVIFMGDRLKSNAYDEFHQVWLTNLGGLPRGIPTLMKSYLDVWPKGTLHLRSNVAEIGRVFYKGPRLDSVTPEGLTYWWNPHMANDPDAIHSFAEYSDVTGFNDESMQGYDPLDVFYWEHRMGHWHAWLCLESDIVHDTFPIYSHRDLLETMLSAPFDDRQSASVFHRAIEVMWPELQSWPINPKNWTRPSDGLPKSD